MKKVPICARKDLRPGHGLSDQDNLWLRVHLTTDAMAVRQWIVKMTFGSDENRQELYQDIRRQLTEETPERHLIWMVIPKLVLISPDGDLIIVVEGHPKDPQAITRLAYSRTIWHNDYFGGSVPNTVLTTPTSDICCDISGAQLIP